jgi:hypothetical protein
MSPSKISLYTPKTVCFLAAIILALAAIPAAGSAAILAGPGIILYSYGPGSVQIISPEEKRAGRDPETGIIHKEIPGVDILKEQAGDRSAGWTIILPDAPKGRYRLELRGTGRGGVVIDLDARDRRGRVKNTHVFKRVRKGDLLHFILDYSPEPGSRNKVEERNNNTQN